MAEPEPIQEKNEYEKLRDEMNQQFQALKDSFEAKQNEDAQVIEQLKEANKDLQTALMRSAFTTPSEPVEKPKTDEEVYNDKIAELLVKSKRYKSMM